MKKPPKTKADSLKITPDNTVPFSEHSWHEFLEAEKALAIPEKHFAENAPIKVGKLYGDPPWDPFGSISEPNPEEMAFSA